MENKRKNLVHDKEAMGALIRMVKAGKSDLYIQTQLYGTFGIRWSTRTIARRRCSEGFKKTSPIPITKQKRRVTASKISTPANNSTLPKNRIAQHFNDLNPDTLSFAELCEYTASFFERIANYPRKQKAPQEWWDTARDKIMTWNRIRQRTKVDFSVFTIPQAHAFDYCMSMHEHSINGGPYSEVYALFREWDRSLLRLTGK
jgi:hypothetical protein